MPMASYGTWLATADLTESDRRASCWPTRVTRHIACRAESVSSIAALDLQQARWAGRAGRWTPVTAASLATQQPPMDPSRIMPFRQRALSDRPPFAQHLLSPLCFRFLVHGPGNPAALARHAGSLSAVRLYAPRQCCAGGCKR
jgi:hypothetical protein